MSAQLVLFGRLTVGTVFLVAGVGKLGRLPSFVRAVGNFGLVPSVLVPPFAVGVLGLELGAAGCLIAGVAVRPALIVSAVLLAAFTVAIVTSLQRGRRVTCGCFGALSGKPVSWTSALRNAFLEAVCVASSVGSAQGAAASLSAVDVSVVVFISSFVLVLLALIGELGSLLGGPVTGRSASP